MNLNTPVYESAQAENANIHVYEKLKKKDIGIRSKTDNMQKNNSPNLGGIDRSDVKTSSCFNILLITNIVLLGACLAISIAGITLPMIYPSKFSAADHSTLEKLTKELMKKMDEDYQILSEKISQHFKGKL